MPQPNDPLRTVQRWSLAAAIVGVVICAAISWDRPAILCRAYLAGYMVCWPVTLGAAGLLAIGNLTGGKWAAAAGPMYLATARTIPLVAILFLPIALSIPQIYPWAAPSSAELALPPSKAAYLQPTFFLYRAAGYIAVWLIVIGLLNHVSTSRLLPASTPAMRRIGALALVLLVPTATFAAFDWAMSLEPHWYSSIYGAIIIAGGVLAAHALAVTGLVASRESEPPTATADVEIAQVDNDLGNLLLAFLMVFGYLAFSQFLVIWSGNLPAEITWYLRRLRGGWQWVALVMVALALIAFFQLLSRERKRTPRQLFGVAVLLLAMYLVHSYWITVPAFDESGLGWQTTNVAAIFAVAGGWMAAYCWHTQRSIKSRQAS